MIRGEECASGAAAFAQLRRSPRRAHHLTPPPPPRVLPRRYQDRGLPFCYVGYFDGMEEGVLRANVIEAKINDVAVRAARARGVPLAYSRPQVRYERPGAGDESEGVDVYSQGEVVPAERVIAAAGFRKGEHYHIDDGQDAINNIYACGEGGPPPPLGGGRQDRSPCASR